MEEERNTTIRRIWKQDIISRVAYLIGVPIRIFESEPEPPKLDIYKKLDANKPARIIRHLNIVKTDILHNYGRIKLSMQTEAKSIYGIPKYIPEQSLRQLSADGVPLSAARNVVDCLTEINRIISDRLTLPMPKGRGFLDHPPPPSPERSSAMSPSVYRFGCAPPYHSIYQWSTFRQRACPAAAALPSEY